MTARDGKPLNALAEYASIAGPEPSLTEDERFERALSYATQVAGHWTKDGQVFIPSIEPGMTELDAAISPVWTRRGMRTDEEEEFSHYDFPRWPSNEWRAALFASRRHRQLIFERVGYNLMKGAPIPDELRTIAGAHLQGFIEPLPAPQGKPSMRHRDTLIVGIAKRVRADFGYPVGANKATFQKRASVPLCGCTFAAAALHAWGVSVTFKRANDICTFKGLPLEEAAEAGVFKPVYLFITRALMKTEEDAAQILDRARKRLLSG